MKSPELLTPELTAKNPDIQGVAALVFIKITDYTTFQGEYAITNGDLVFHFDRTDEIRALPQGPRDVYWHRTFAECLNEVAQRIFEAGPPELQGQFIDEPDLGVIQSWWFKASGFGHILDPHKKVYAFLDALDSALDAASSRQ
jgi:hypothetical protein